jgi:hypothetical protein
MNDSPRQITATDLRDTGLIKIDQFGAVGQTEDGRKFRYVGSGATPVTSGQLVVAAAVVANHTNIAVQANAAVGALVLTVTLGATAATQDQYAEGFVTVNAGTGLGTTYRVAGSSAAASGGVVTLNLAEPLVSAVTSATSKVSLAASPFSAVLTSVTVSRPLGIATTAIPANGFGWIQTYGYCSAVSDVSAPAKGAALKQSTATAGAIAAVAVATDFSIGSAPEAAISAEARAVWLNVE